jgi:O-antigen/teichoic acid export membrane protein
MLGKNILRQILTQFTGLICALIVSVVTARILGPELRGDFALLINSANFLIFLLGFNFGTSIVHIVAHKRMAVRPLINTLLVVLFGLAVSTLLILFIVSRFDGSFFLPKTGNHHFYIILLVLLFTFSTITSIYGAILSGNKLFKLQQIVAISIFIISILFHSLLYFFRGSLQLDFNEFLTFYTVMAALPALSTYLIFFFRARPSFSFSFLGVGELKYFMKFSMVAYLASIFYFLNTKIDFWIVDYYGGNIALGYYSLSSNLSQMIWLLPQAVSVILLAYAGDVEQTRNIHNVNVLMRVSLVVVGFIGVLLVVTADFFIPFLYGNKFEASADLFKILLIGVVPFSVTTILSAHFAGKGKIIVNLYCSLVGFGTRVFLDFLLIPKFGVSGASYAATSAYIFSTIFIVGYFLRDTGGTLRALLVFSKDDYYFLKEKFRLLLKS